MEFIVESALKGEKEKSKVYLDGLDQGLRLQKEKQLEHIRKVLYVLVLSLNEEEMEILSKIMQKEYTSNPKKVEE